MTGLAATVAGFALFAVVVVVVSLLGRAAPEEKPRPNDPGQLARGTASCAVYFVALIALGIAALVVLAIINPA